VYDTGASSLPLPLCKIGGYARPRPFSLSRPFLIVFLAHPRGRSTSGGKASLFRLLSLSPPLFSVLYSLYIERKNNVRPQGDGEIVEMGHGKKNFRGEHVGLGSLLFFCCTSPPFPLSFSFFSFCRTGRR
jgi:hypothetical protein